MSIFKLEDELKRYKELLAYHENRIFFQGDCVDNSTFNRWVTAQRATKDTVAELEIQVRDRKIELLQEFNLFLGDVA